MQINILTSDNTPLSIELNNKAAAHFSAPASHIDCILHQQINTDRIYDFYFKNKQDLTIVDAGANVGIFSLYAHTKAKRIYSIEPTPDHFDILKQLTQPFSNIIPINCALWSNDTELRFFVNPNNTTANTAMNSNGIPITVKARSLPSLIKEYNIDHIDLIKMDIEGAEFNVVSDEFIEYCYPIIDSWFLEVHTSALCHTFDLCKEKMSNMFKKHNYNVESKSSDGLFIYK
jgi:FkbM family methyltransferase